MSARRNIWVGLILVVVLGAVAITSAAAWNVTGYFTKEASNNDRHVYVSVADENGLPVTHLQPVDFAVEYFTCQAQDCGVKSATITTGATFKEDRPGAYAFSVKLDPVSTTTAGLILRVKQSAGGRGTGGPKTAVQRAQVVLIQVTQ